MSDKILRLKTVKEKTGLSRSMIYLLIKERSFPLPIHLGVRAVGWVESDISSWIAGRIEASRNRLGNPK